MKVKHYTNSKKDDIRGFKSTKNKLKELKILLEDYEAALSISDDADIQIHQRRP